MTRNLDIGLLRTFVTVAEQRSMTKASERLHLTQGAISQQIARLEGLLGNALLLRDPRGLRLTPAGERFLRRVRPLIAVNDEIWSEIENGAVAGPVKLGLPPDLVAPCFAATLKNYCETFPQVDLTLTCAPSPDLLNLVGDGSLDIAVVEEPVEAAGGETLAIDCLVWVGARAGSAQSRSPLPISLVAETCVFKPAVTAALARAERSSRMVFESGGLDATRTVVRMDLALSAWLATTVPADLEIVAPEAGLPRLPCFAITLHRAEAARGAAFDELACHLRGAMSLPRLVA